MAQKKHLINVTKNLSYSLLSFLSNHQNQYKIYEILQRVDILIFMSLLTGDVTLSSANAKCLILRFYIILSIRPSGINILEGQKGCRRLSMTR